MSPKSLVKNKSTLSSWPSAANCSLPISSCRCGMIQRFNETSWVKTSWNIDSSEAQSLQFSHCWSADIWVMKRWYKKLLGHLLPKQFQDKCRMTTCAFPGLVNIWASIPRHLPPPWLRPYWTMWLAAFAYYSFCICICLAHFYRSCGHGTWLLFLYRVCFARLL